MTTLDITPLRIKNDLREIVLEVYSFLNAEERFHDNSQINDDFGWVIVAEETDSLQPLKHFFSEVARAFPDFRLNIDKIVEKGNRVMVRYTITGTQKATFMLRPPTNIRTTISGIDVFTIYEGKVIEYFDTGRQINCIR
jgi:predicted ester cyclase